MSIVSLLVQAYDELKTEMEKPGNVMLEHQHPNREFALARTAIEEAIMRTNVGFSKLQGNYYMSDVQIGTQHIPRV